MDINHLQVHLYYLKILLYLKLILDIGRIILIEDGEIVWIVFRIIVAKMEKRKDNSDIFINVYKIESIYLSFPISLVQYLTLFHIIYSLPHKSHQCSSSSSCACSAVAICPLNNVVVASSAYYSSMSQSSFFSVLSYSFSI